MNFDNYIFRSHMVGKIINVPKPLTTSQTKTLADFIARENGEGKALTPKQKETLIELKYKKIQTTKYSLTDGQKTILSELAFAEKFNRSKIIYSDALTKGIEKEKDSRDLLSKATGVFLTHSTERKKNKWVTGAIDIKPNNVIIDLKTAKSWESFMKILQDKPNEIYLRQLDCYMELWGLQDSLLVHTLVDTPTKIIEGELRRVDYKLNILDHEGNVRDERIPEVKRIVYNHIFTEKGLKEYCKESSVVNLEWFTDFQEIPEHERVHMISHSFDKVRIEQRNECIRLAREYMNKVTPINNFNPALVS